MPAGAAVRGDQELLADYAVAGLPAGGHHRAADRDDTVDDLEDPALLLPGIGVEGDGTHRQPRRGGVWGLVRFGTGRAELGPVAGQQSQGQHGHGHHHDGRHHDPHRSAAAQTVAGLPGGWHPVVEQQGVVRGRLLQHVRIVGVVRVVGVVQVSAAGRGHQAGRAFPDGRPVVAPPVLPGKAVVLVDAGAGIHRRAQRDRHPPGPARGVMRARPLRCGRLLRFRRQRRRRLRQRRLRQRRLRRALVRRLRSGAPLPLDAGFGPEPVRALPWGQAGLIGTYGLPARRAGTGGLETRATRAAVAGLSGAEAPARRLRGQRGGP